MLDDIFAKFDGNYIKYRFGRPASATIRRRIASISSVLKLGGHPDPTGDPEVVLATKCMHRR